ncbi:MAG: FAD-binding protein, partial [Bacteroidia bacterium]|nr:FAD-binding protein [Bacteroidia bacterium]
VEVGKQSLDHLDEATIIKMGKEVVKEKYGNLFDMYEKITGENPYEVPMRIYPAVHYTMGGLWVDYELQTTVPGLYALGECNFSDHGANRLGASALMQGLADGYFVIPYTLGNYLADEIRVASISTDHPAFAETEKAVAGRIDQLMNIKGAETVESFHKRLGKIMWEKCGMARNAKGLQEAIAEIQQLKKEFWSNVKIPGEINSMNPELDKANRVADFIELGELTCIDALNRNESCGGHFREEYQTPEGEAKRDDENYTYAAAWEYKDESKWELFKEELKFEVAKPTQRSYK